jgi:hypothetical protein
MIPNLLTRCLPCRMGPLGLLHFVREHVSGEDKTRIFMHGLEQHLLDAILIVRGLGFGAWSVSLTKWCWRLPGMFLSWWQQISVHV